MWQISTTMTTLAGYIQWKMTGERVVGVGEASGIFQSDSKTNTYFADMIAKFDEAVADKAYSWKALRCSAARSDHR